MYMLSKWWTICSGGSMNWWQGGWFPPHCPFPVLPFLSYFAAKRPLNLGRQSGGALQAPVRAAKRLRIWVQKSLLHGCNISNAVLSKSLTGGIFHGQEIVACRWGEASRHPPLWIRHWPFVIYYKRQTITALYIHANYITLRNMQYVL